MEQKQSEALQKRVNEYINALHFLMGERGNFERQWQEVSQLIFPNQSRTFNAYNIRAPGEKRTQYIYDAGPVIDLGRFVAVLQYLITPATQTYHFLEPKDPALKKDRETREYLQTVNKILFSERTHAKAQFSPQNQVVYKSTGAFGIGSLFLDERRGKDAGLLYRNVPVGQVYFAEGDEGAIDSAYRVFWMTARQMAQKWDEENLPDGIKAVLPTEPNRKFKVLHVVHPNTDRDDKRIDYRGMAFASCYIAFEQRHLLSEGGYRTFPYAIARWSSSPDEIYPSGPGMDVLPSIKMLNKIAESFIKQTHRIVEPAYIAGAEIGAMRAFNVKPNALNYGFISADGKDMIRPMPTGNLPEAEPLIQNLKAVVKAALLTDIFQILVESPQKTATEVLELEKEKGILLAPTVEALQAAYLEALVSREIDILFWQGKLPPMPRKMAMSGGRFQIRFESPMTRLQKAAEATGAERQLQSAIALATSSGKPEILDNYDWDKSTRGLAQIRGYPEEWLADEDTMTATREQRAQASQQQQMNEAAPGAAALGKVAVLASKGGGAAAGGLRSPKS